MRTLTLVLAGLLLLIQYPLWLGKGGWARVWEHDRQLSAQRAKNEALQARNAALDAEVRDLKQGLEAVEERARFELGMVRPDEVFFQIVDRPRVSPSR
jgi:cell division protein FtsB